MKKSGTATGAAFFIYPYKPFIKQNLQSTLFVSSLKSKPLLL